MHRAHVVTLTQEDGRVVVRWGEGAPRRAPELQPEAPVILRAGARPLGGLGSIAELRQEDQDAVGRYLLRALGPPDGALAPGDLLELRITPRFALALPWHLIRDEVGWLLARGVRLRVHPLPLRPQVPLSLHIHALVVDTRPELPELRTAEGWEGALGPLLGHHLKVDEVDATPPPSLGPLDVLHLLVEGVTEQGHLRLLGGTVWPELPALCEANRPRMLILELPGPPGADVARLASGLAAHLPCVVLACPPAATELAPDVFATGPRLLAAMLEEQLAPADAARLLEARERRGPARGLWVWGGAQPPRPDRQSQVGRWYFDEGWRISLDRRTQTWQAVGAIRDARAARRPQGGRRPAGVVLLWHGPAHSGLARFRERLRWQLTHREEPALPTALLPLRWPEVPTEQDLAAQYAAALGESPERNPGEARERLRGRVARHVEAQLGATGDAALIMHHGELSATDDADRLDPETLCAYVRWWAEALVPAVPDHVTPVLALTVAAADGDPLPGRVAAALTGLRGLRPVVVVALPSLPDIVADDIVNHIEEFELMDRSSLDERVLVAEEIAARTGGRYEPTVQLIEQIPWAWAELLQAARRRRKRP